MQKPILSIETATHVCSAALHHEGNLINLFEYHGKSVRSDVIYEMVHELLHTGHITPNQLAAVCTSRGPGSYTGLRLGTSLAKGLCCGTNIPLIAVGTLETLLLSYPYRIPDEAMMYGLLDARRGYAYGLAVNHNREKMKKVHICHVIKATFEIWKRPIYFLGSGAEAYREQLEQITDARILAGIYPTAKAMGKLAWEQFVQGNLEDRRTFTPHYFSRQKSYE